MMKMVFAIPLLLLSTLTAASPPYSPGIDLRQARLTDVIDTYYRLVSKAPYVVCPAATGAVGRVSVRAPINMTRRALATILRVNGLSLRVENGIDVICEPKQSAVGSVSSSAPASASIEPYGPPEAWMPSGSPLTPSPPVMRSASVAAVPEAFSDAPEPPEPVKSDRMVYRVRYRAAEELLPMLQSLDLGSFAVIGQGTSRVDGSTSSALGGKAGDVILWQGGENDRETVEDMLDQLDQPSARAYVEIAAVAISDVQNSSASLSLVGDLLGVGSSIGTPGAGFSIKIGGMGVNFDALESSRKLRVVKRWSGYVTSGRDIETLNGGNVPVVSNITESSTGRVTQGITYQPTGLSMHVSPTVLDEVVRLSVNLRDQAVAGGGGTAPAFETRSLIGDMEICFGCVSVISSLDDQTTDSTKSKFLGFVPVNRGKLSQRTRLIYIAYVRAKHGDAVNGAHASSVS